MTRDGTGQGADYERVERAILYLDRHMSEQPALEEVAAEAGLSPFHFQRLFRRWAGTTPKRFLQALTVDHAKRLLRESTSVLDAAFEVGLSGPSRLHDHFVSLEAVSPGEYKSRGAGLRILYGVHPSPFGPMLLAATERGICSLAFVGGRDVAAEVEALARDWRGAALSEDGKATGALAERIFDGGEGVPLLIRGTNFQVQVWRALLSIPPGALVTYGELARAVGRPRAPRAAAGAVAANRIAYLIPCHRVIRSLGEPGGYRWGTIRKRAMIAWESARAERTAVA